MHDPCAYDYALIRVLPHVERGECINAGVLVCSTARGFLQARIELDEARLLALDPAADIATVSASLEAFVRICEGGPRSGPIGQLPLRSRFDSGACRRGPRRVWKTTAREKEAGRARRPARRPRRCPGRRSGR